MSTIFFENLQPRGTRHATTVVEFARSARNKILTLPWLNVNASHKFPLEQWSLLSKDPYCAHIFNMESMYLYLKCHPHMDAEFATLAITLLLEDKHLASVFGRFQYFTQVINEVTLSNDTYCSGQLGNSVTGLWKVVRLLQDCSTNGRIWKNSFCRCSIALQSCSNEHRISSPHKRSYIFYIARKIDY